MDPPVDPDLVTLGGHLATSKPQWQDRARSQDLWPIIINAHKNHGIDWTVGSPDIRDSVVAPDSTIPRNQFPNPLVCSSEPTTTGPFTFFNADGTESGDGRNVVNCENVVFTQPYRPSFADRSFQLNFERCWAETIVVSDGTDTWTVTGDQGECTDPSAGPIKVVEGQAVSITLTVQSEPGREFAYYVSSRAEPLPNAPASEESDGQDEPETALPDFAAPPLVLRDDQPGTANQLAPLAGGGIVGVGDPEFGVEIWDLAGQSPRSSYPGHGTTDIYAFTELGDDRLVTGGELGFQIWAIGDTDSDTGRLCASWPGALDAITLFDGQLRIGRRRRFFASCHRAGFKSARGIGGGPSLNATSTRGSKADC